jgi:bacteriorhodopsin
MAEAQHIHNAKYEAVREGEGYLKLNVANQDTANIAAVTPMDIAFPQNAENVHQRNYVLAAAISEGHKIQAADIHAAGFLNANDPVAISFWIISIAMIAATVFFLMEALTLKTHWKTSLHVGALVTLVAAVHYLYMREYWVKFQQSPIVYRYIDWSITVPLQMIEFYLILSAVNPNISGGMFWRLMIGTVAMLAFGYLGESGNMNPWLGFWLGMAGWAFILFEVFFGEAGQAAAKADKMNPFIKSSYNTMRLIVTVGWSIYPLGYFFGYLLHQWGDSPCNFTYNIADFINKIAFCLAIWHAGRRDTLAGMNH